MKLVKLGFKIGDKVKTKKGCRINGNDWVGIVVGFCEGRQNVKVYRYSKEALKTITVRCCDYNLYKVT